MIVAVVERVEMIEMAAVVVAVAIDVVDRVAAVVVDDNAYFGTSEHTAPRNFVVELVVVAAVAFEFVAVVDRVDIVAEVIVAAVVVVVVGMHQAIF